jgi:hypothetical protein
VRAAAFAVLMALSFASLAAPRAELWERWAASKPSKVAIDHSAWNEFLARHVQEGKDGINRIAYANVGLPRAAAGRHDPQVQPRRAARLLDQPL